MDNLFSNAMSQFYDMVKKDPVIEINERKYKRRGYEPVTEPTVSVLETHTLQGIVDAVKADVEPLGNEIKLHIHVFDPTSVYLESQCFGPFLQRHVLIKSSAYVTDFRFGQGYNPEEFIIALNSQFIPNEDQTKLLELCSTITKETSGTVVDTGVSQKMEVKSGVSMRDKVEVKNPFLLMPYRTFSEVQQPESDFVFRVKDDGHIRCALYEADGSAWKIQAIENIKSFFTENLPDIPVIA